MRCIHSTFLLLLLATVKASESHRDSEDQKVVSSQYERNVPLAVHGSHSDSSWHILGPFQIGTREITWGADPLEKYGGFRNLIPDAARSFSSSLAPNGTVGWSTATAAHTTDTGGISNVQLDISFPSIDWAFSRDVYGWAGLQWQAWARGSIIVNSNQPQTAIIHTDGIVEFWVDEQQYFGGDLYGFRRASPVLHLNQGIHWLNLRLVRDVRAMGADGDPNMTINIELRAVKSSLNLVEGSIIVADIVDDSLAGSMASISTRNDGLNKIRITNIACYEKLCRATPVNAVPIFIWPGQSRPLAFQLSLFNQSIIIVEIVVVYDDGNNQTNSHKLNVQIVVPRVSKLEPQKYTFLHAGGIVSYAIIKPPSTHAMSDSNGIHPLNILVSLHGAGVEAQSDAVRHSLDALANLRLIALFPNGVTSWSGDDWHEWGFADIEAAINSIPQWMEATQWASPKVNLANWIIAGHSNGGQGVYYAITHKPNKIIAAAPVSGYSSIQKYVPYVHWQEADPRAASIVQSVLSDYRHELLIENAARIPILLQHSSKDENVPVYHSRRMHELLSDISSSNEPCAEYHEIPDRMHWFEGIMTTKKLRDFFAKHLSATCCHIDENISFTMTVTNPGSTGAKGGIQILQLQIPGQLGKFEVDSNSSRLVLVTTNVRRLSISLLEHGQKTWVLDGQELLDKIGHYDHELVRGVDGTWKKSEGNLINERRGRQLGSLSAILRTIGHFSIVNTHPSTMWIAIQLSRNLFQYFGADADIVETPSSLAVSGGNVITVNLGINPDENMPSRFPIHVDSKGFLVLRNEYGVQKTFIPGKYGLGAVFLGPRPDEGLELVVWGSDVASVAVAARLVPTLTGSGQPDFVIMTRECLWKGLNGILAMGFFDSLWNVSQNSFYL